MMNGTKKIAKSNFLLILLMVLQFVLTRECGGQVLPEPDVPKGTIKGQVADGETKAPLIAANILIEGTGTGTITDLNGNFSIPDVPVGNYTLKISYIGYETLSKTDIIVKSKRLTFVLAELKATPVQLQDVVVSAGYFSQTQDQPTSAINFSSEEIRRAPGSAGDVSRIVSVLPSIAKVNDQSNSLIVRGGSPVESGFFIDNIEIPNINHYPTQGSSGGPIGLLNVDFIRDVNFYSGGFSAAYGDRLSSIMDLSFREGNRYEFDGQLDLNFAGFGFLGEGPLGTEKGSWLFSARRSFLDLLIDAIGTGVAPKYSDYQGKLVYDLNKNHRITGLGILGKDFIAMTKGEAEDEGNFVYFDNDFLESSIGINWRSLWGEEGFSNTSLSHISTKFKGNVAETRTDRELFKSNSLEQAILLRNVNSYSLNESNRLEFGLEARHVIHEYDNFIGKYTDAMGDSTPEFSIDDRITAHKFGSFASHTWKPFDKITAFEGVRFDYFSYSKNSHISPRLSLSYQLNERTSINGSTGIYYQNLPLILLSQKEEFQNLKDPVAYHYILGLGHLLTENTKMNIEVYEKDYDNFPLDPTTPPLFILDELFYRYGFFFNHEELADNGKAYSRGIEMMIQKKLAKDVYGLLSGSYFRTRYRDFDGIWRDRVFDNRILFSAEGGYKPNNRWEFSMRWIYAGGPPYTPFDIGASQAINRGVFDQNNINGARYPDYHSLNVRFDRRFHFSGSNLIFYFSVWNAYNRKNIASYFWDEIENKQDTTYQWSLLPVFGLEFEF